MDLVVWLEQIMVGKKEINSRAYLASFNFRGADQQKRERVAEVTESQRRLADHLQTRVRVDFGKRKGKITLDFASLEELERLTRVILGDEPGSAESRVTPG